MTRANIETMNCKYHHTASRRGYESRRRNPDGSLGHIEAYSGKFGTGYIKVLPRWDTTNYVKIEYYIA